MGRHRSICVVDPDARFDALQERLIPLWPAIRTWSSTEQTVVVIPSYGLDEAVLRTVEHLLSSYEERFLYMLLLLRQPKCRILLVTSNPVPGYLVSYWLDHVPHREPAEARRRLMLLSLNDRTARPLSMKLLERADLLQRIRALVAETPAHLAMFNVGRSERDLALALDVPVYGASHRCAPWGSKAGARRLFAQEGLPHPPGTAVNGLSELGPALREMRSPRAVIKLNHGVSGLGNIVVPTDGSVTVPDGFASQLDAEGGVVEELLEADEITSPSVQLRITPLGKVQILSTHDQLLGGATRQTYLGARFPADPSYARDIARLGDVVGRRLAREGVVGRLAVDFVCVRDGAAWSPRAIEINLRKGGTTHPFLTLQYLTDGAYDHDSATFRLDDGTTRSYVASDALGHEELRGLDARTLIEELRRSGLAYDPSTRTGVVLQMTSALEPAGKFGLTAIARTTGEAAELSGAALSLTDQLAAPAIN